VDTPAIGAQALVQAVKLNGEGDMPEKKYFKNQKTWKQVSTNLPPHMYQALRGQVTGERTMSHVLRELIADSSLMRAGVPNTNWPLELASELRNLRQEIAELKAGVLAVPKTESQSEPERELDFKPKWLSDFEMDYLCDSADSDPASEAVQFFNEVQDKEEAEPEPVPDREPAAKPFSFIGKLTDMLSVGRKTA